MNAEFLLSNLRLVIKLPDVGLCVFAPNSGTGKTYLCTLLKKMSLPEVATVTYDSNANIMNVMIEEAIKKDVIIFDRFDMYATDELLEKIVNLSTAKLIILDYKNRNTEFLTDYEIVNVTLTDKEMRVY